MVRGVYRCFNLRPRTEGDPLDRDASTRPQCFNLRPRTEGDIALKRNWRPLAVSICALARRATSSSLWPKIVPSVSICALARRATAAWQARCPWEKLTFQSAPSHGGRRWAKDYTQGKAGVSICALARRATSGKTGRMRPSRVSICALARRATPAALKASSVPLCFNLRPRTEGDFRHTKTLQMIREFQSAPSHGGRL